MMFSNKEFMCPSCKNSLRHSLFFLHDRFHYMCPTCQTIHFLSNNILYDENDYFMYSPEFTRYSRDYSRYYLGSLLPDGTTINANASVETDWKKAEFKKFLSFYNFYNNKQESNLNIQIEKYNSVSSDRFFLVNGLYRHFNHGLRSAYRMYEHIRQSKERTTNIVIVFSCFKHFYTPLKEKFNDMVDYVITVPWDDYLATRDYYAPNEKSNKFSHFMNDFIEQHSGNGSVIGDRPGPNKDISGYDICSVLLNPDATTQGIPNLGDKKYIVVAAKREFINEKANMFRSGLSRVEQFDALFSILKDYKQNYCILSFDGEIFRNEDLSKRYGVVHLKNLSIEEQCYLYKHNCLGFISAMGSGMNNPSVYKIPILSFAKYRSWASSSRSCDFYCYSKMLSPYEAGAEEYVGIKEFLQCKTHKPDFVEEVSVEECLFDPLKYEAQIRKFMERFK